MLPPVNLQEKLLKIRNKELKKTSALQWVQSVFDELDEKRAVTLQQLQRSKSDVSNQFNIDKIDVNAVFHITQIQKMCIDYRLRFLDTAHFKGEYPEEAVSKIHQLEKEHETTLDGFKIAAPAVLFKLKKADDPLLFAPMGNDYYYLIYKWGNDLHPLRKITFWSIKTVRNLCISLVALSLLLTLATHTFFFRNHSNTIYFILLFLFFFKGAVGFALYFGISSGKNFSQYCWQSRFDKIC